MAYTPMRDLFAGMSERQTPHVVPVIPIPVRHCLYCRSTHTVQKCPNCGAAEFETDGAAGIGAYLSQEFVTAAPVVPASPPPAEP